MTYEEYINFVVTRQRRKKNTDPVRQILRGENPTKTFLIINDEDTVGAFGSTQLTRLGYCDILRHCKRGAGLESGDSSLRRGSLSRTFGGAALMCGYGTFAGELGFDFLPDGLELRGKVSKLNK